LILYYRARWYDPKQRRFLTEDPKGFKGGLDLYSYVLDNPVSNVDPLGFGLLCVLSYGAKGAGVGGLIGMGVGAVGGLAGLAGGPVVIVSEPAAILTGGSYGAGIGFLVGTYEGAVNCSKSTPCDYEPESEEEKKKEKEKEERNRRIEDCTKEWIDEQAWCSQQFSGNGEGFRKNKRRATELGLCYARALERYKNCMAGLGSPGVLNPDNPNWSQH
jgi:uncharacterized protein RhaS with RHS repeats